MNWCKLLLVLLISQQVYGQNFTDENGRKQGLWIYTGAMRPEAGYPPEGIIEQGNYTDDRKDGVWTKYYEDGVTPKLKGEYRNNRPNGPYENYFPDGQLREKSCFERGQYSCELSRWYENGGLREYRNSDSSLYYLENGCLEYMIAYDSVSNRSTHYTYVTGQCNIIKDSVIQSAERTNNYGVIREVVACNFGQNRSSNTIRTEKFIQASPEYADSALCSCISDETRQKCYNSSTEIIFQGTCVDGKLNEGRLYFYDEDMILLRIEVWKDGVYCRDGHL